MRICTFVGTRPELIKLSRVIPALDTNFEHALVHTGQNWTPELKDNIFKDLKLRAPDLQLDLSNAGPWAPAMAVSRVMEYCDQVLQAYPPDAVLILGDTNSAVAAAYAAKRRHIPIFHMEAGNRCFDDRTPEEVNRRIIDTIADVNLPYTEHAVRNLLAMGCRPDRVIKTGSPMGEVLNYFKPEIDGHRGRPPLSYYVVSCHREENADVPERVCQLVEAINVLSAFGTVLVSVHPRLRDKLQKFCFTSRVQLRHPFGFIEYARLQRDAKCVISDSGTLAEEAAILKFPAVSIRYGTERPEAFEDAVMVLSDLKKEKVLEAVTLAESFGRIHRGTPVDYQDENVSVKVAQIIASYADKVRRER